MPKEHMRSIAHFLVNHTVKMFLGIMIITLILGYQATTLKCHISFDYLLPDDNPKIEIFNQIQHVFGNDSNILLLANGSEDSLRSFAYRIKPLLESFDIWVSGVHTETPVDFLRENFLKLMDPDELDNYREIFNDPNLIPFLSNLNNAFENTFLHPKNEIISHRNEQNAVDFLDRLQLFIKSQEEIMLDTESLDVGQKAVDAIVFGQGLQLSLDRDMLLIIIEPAFNMHIPAIKLQSNVNGIENIIDKIAIQHGIKTGLVGPLIKARDNYTAFLSGFWRLSILSLGGFLFVLILFFRMWSMPIILINTLIVCVLWSLGIYSFFLESINLISILSNIIFILFGLGNCIIFISGFSERRKNGLTIELAMRETLEDIGSCSILSGCVMGGAFLTLIFSEIKICQDLGIMAGVGIITTMILTIIFLPSMLILIEKVQEKSNPLDPIKDTSYRLLGRGAKWFAKYRRISFISIIIITLLLFYQSIHIDMDTSLSNLGSHNLDEIKIEDELFQSFGMSSSLISFTTDDMEITRVLTKQAREITSNGWVESISDYLPDEKFNNNKFRYLRELRRKVNSREVRKQLSSHDMIMYRNEIERLEANIIELQDFSLQDSQSKIYEKTKYLVGDEMDSNSQGILSQFINTLDTGMNRMKLTYFQEQFASAFKSTVLKMANTEPLTLHNLPIGIKNRFIGANDNIFRINVYSHKNIWNDTIDLNRYVNNLSLLNESITGWAVLFVELKNSISNFGFQTFLVFIISLMLLLLIGLRSLKYSLIIMASIISSLFCMMGILTLLNIKLNLVNICIFPTIIIVGVSNGIQILCQLKHKKNLCMVFSSIGKAILITMITINIIVLPFWFMNHTGLNSITCVLLIGLMCSFLSQLIIIPSVLGEDTYV